MILPNTQSTITAEARAFLRLKAVSSQDHNFLWRTRLRQVSYQALPATIRIRSSRLHPKMPWIIPNNETCDGGKCSR